MKKFLAKPITKSELVFWFAAAGLVVFGFYIFFEDSRSFSDSVLGQLLALVVFLCSSAFVAALVYRRANTLRAWRKSMKALAVSVLVVSVCTSLCAGLLGLSVLHGSVDDFAEDIVLLLLVLQLAIVCTALIVGLSFGATEEAKQYFANHRNFISTKSSLPDHLSKLVVVIYAVILVIYVWELMSYSGLEPCSDYYDANPPDNWVP